MRRFLKIIFILLLLVGAGLVGLNYFAGALISPYVQKEAVQALNAQGIGAFDMEVLRIQRLLPLKFEVRNFSGSFPDKNLQFLISKLHGEVQPVGFKLNLLKVRFQFDQVTLSGPTPALRIQFPLTVTSEVISINENVLASENIELNLAGLIMSLRGRTHFTEVVHDWAMQVHLDDLRTLPVPPSFLPPGNWQGGIVGHARLKGQNGGLSLSANFATRNLLGDVDYKSNLGAVRGRIAPEFVADMAYDGTSKQLDLKQFHLNADLSPLEIHFPEYFHKPAKVPLRVRARAQGNTSNVEVGELEIRFDKMAIHGGGRLHLQAGQRSQIRLRLPRTDLAGMERYFLPLRSMPMKGQLDVGADIDGDLFAMEKAKVKLTTLNLSHFAAGFALKDLGLAGNVAGNIQASGSFDLERGIEESPLAVTGDVTLIVPSYRYVSAAAEDLNSKSSTSTSILVGQDNLPSAQPLLPAWQIVRNSKVNMSLKLGKFHFDQLTAKQIEAKAVYDRGQVRGALSLGQVFGGQVRARSISASGLFSNPRFQADLTMNRLGIVPLIQFIKPEYAEKLTGGTLSGQVSASLPMPQTKNWLLQTTVQGDLSGTEIRTKEDIVADALGEKLAKFAREKKAISKNPIVANMNAKFAMKGNAVSFKSFKVITRDNNEFVGSGTVDLDLNANLKGTLFLSKVDVGGSVRAANSDSKGRFTLPVTVKGPLLSPSFDIAKETLEVVAERTLKYEAKKAASEAKSKLKDKLKDEAKKRLKELFK